MHKCTYADLRICVYAYESICLGVYVYVYAYATLTIPISLHIYVRIYVYNCQRTTLKGGRSHANNVSFCLYVYKYKYAINELIN